MASNRETIITDAPESGPHPVPAQAGIRSQIPPAIPSSLEGSRAQVAKAAATTNLEAIVFLTFFACLFLFLIE